MTEPVPPISTQVSRLAQLAPDEAAITCEGRTITRGELDASTNRLARAYAELGVGVGDYVTMVLPNSIEFLLAAIAAWKLGAVPQPLPTRLPDAEFEGLLDLRPRALLVGRSDPRGDIPSVPTGFHAGSGIVGCGSAGGGVAILEGDGVRRQHRTAQADRVWRRQSL